MEKARQTVIYPLVSHTTKTGVVSILNTDESVEIEQNPA